jgi:sulfide:quinone oxidoreductase
MRVVIAGGGVAGLEALLALSALAEDLIDVELVSPSEEFVYRPMLVAEPFGSAEAVTLDVRRMVEEAGASHTRDRVTAVDLAARTAATAGGKSLRYDWLLIALGANPVEAVPGALTFGSADERASFADLLGRLGRTGMKRLAFVVPRATTWSIAAYELALLTARERDTRRLPGVEILLVTHEAAPLDLFGSSASKHVAARLEQAGVSFSASSRVERFVEGQLQVSKGAALAADAAVALPALEVPPLPGLPQRAHGFLQTDTAMHVAGLETVWAAGDVTWFPIKQGGLAAQQADVAARSIAARAGAHVPLQPFQPVLRGALITGETPEFLRSSPGLPGGEAAATGRALWWPPTKIAGRYLGPYIARALGEETPPELVDLEPPASADSRP